MAGEKMLTDPVAMPTLGEVKQIEPNALGNERYTQLQALVECPGCGREVECWAETEEWTETDDGRWVHSGYGGSFGVCEPCHLLIADCLMDGFKVFDLRG